MTEPTARAKRLHRLQMAISTASAQLADLPAPASSQLEVSSRGIYSPEGTGLDRLRVVDTVTSSYEPCWPIHLSGQGRHTDVALFPKREAIGINGFHSNALWVVAPEVIVRDCLAKDVDEIIRLIRGLGSASTNGSDA